MKKVRIRFLIQYVWFKTMVLNFIFWPYIHFDFERLMKEKDEHREVTKRLPE